MILGLVDDTQRESTTHSGGNDYSDVRITRLDDGSLLRSLFLGFCTLIGPMSTQKIPPCKVLDEGNPQLSGFTEEYRPFVHVKGLTNNRYRVCRTFRFGSVTIY